MVQLIDKAAVVAEIKRRIKTNKECMLGLRNLDYYQGKVDALNDTISFIDTLEVKDPYEQCVQYDSIKAGIQAHAETYSFNIESELFHQLTKEQQKLWRKEIEEACISGGYAGYQLAKDPRYKENLEAKEVDLEKNVRQVIDLYLEAGNYYNGIIKKERDECGGSDLVIKLLNGLIDAKELGIQYVLNKLNAQKGEEV